VLTYRSPRTPVDFGGLQRTPVDSGGLWWTPVDFGGLQRTPVDSGGLWWTPVDSGGFVSKFTAVKTEYIIYECYKFLENATLQV
jgi:hypothetical protein